MRTRLTAVLLLCLQLSSCGTNYDGGADGCLHLPGGIDPVLLVDGTLYHWKGVNTSSPLIQADEEGRLTSHLPEGYAAAGELGGITEETPVEELQMQAGFPASGTVYTDPERPLVVYVHMTTDWFKETYIRFESDGLAPNLFRWDGRLFRIPIGYGWHLEELPEGCVSIGTLELVAGDILPVHDLECNGSTDCFNHTLRGREVFQDPADPDVLYVFETKYWAEGSYPAWEVCRPWEPGDPLYPAE